MKLLHNVVHASDTPSSYTENTLNARHSFNNCRLAIPAHNSCPSTTTHHPFTFDVLSRNNVSLSHPPPTSSSLQLSTQVLYHKREGGWMQGLETVKLFIFIIIFFYEEQLCPATVEAAGARLSTKLFRRGTAQEKPRAVTTPAPRTLDHKRRDLLTLGIVLEAC